MKNIVLRASLSLILFVAIVFTISAQTIQSEKVKIRINNLQAQAELPPDVRVVTPESLREGETFVSKDEIVPLVLRLINPVEGINISINNVETFSSSGDNIFYKNISLIRGLNNLTVIISKENKVLREIIYSIIYAPAVRNLSPFSVTEGKYYALIIGNGSYGTPGINNLRRPVEDAKALKEVLVTRYIFDRDNVYTLYDMNKDNVLIAMEELQRRITSDDNLLIFYAGHGKMDETADIGYWLLADAHPDRKYTWLSNGQITENIKLLKAKHILLLADACYAGSIFDARGLSDAPSSMQELYKSKSRKAITSGGTTEVSDDSKFAQFLIELLKTNNEKYLSSSGLYSAILRPVQNNSLTSPRWGVIQNVGDMGGDFIFQLREQ